MVYLVLLVVLSLLADQLAAITCYSCESYRDYRCLDPFDFQPFVQVNCDTAAWVREKKPVFCEKRTEIVDGVYVTTRGCSIDYRWEDVASYVDHRGGHLPCIRRGRKETCLCTNDRCNSAPVLSSTWLWLLLMTVTSLGWWYQPIIN